MTLKTNYNNIKATIPLNVELVAVSKTRPISDIEILYNLDQRIFGENRVKELVEKYNSLPKDIEWHMIGHLQSKKVKQIASFVSLIHGVDSFKLLKEINKQAKKNNRIIDCLLQFHIAEESTKFGFTFKELTPFFEKEIKELQNINIKGVMGMATFTTNEALVKKEFKTLASIFTNIKENYLPNIKTISMGMSGDYLIAIDQGSNMVRIGSSIFKH